MVSLQDPSCRSASVLSFFCYDPEAGTTAGNCPLAEFHRGRPVRREGHVDIDGKIARTPPPRRDGAGVFAASRHGGGTVSLQDYLGRMPVLIVLLRYIW